MQNRGKRTSQIDCVRTADQRICDVEVNPVSPTGAVRRIIRGSDRFTQTDPTIRATAGIECIETAGVAIHHVIGGGDNNRALAIIVEIDAAEVRCVVAVVLTVCTHGGARNDDKHAIAVNNGVVQACHGHSLRDVPISRRKRECGRAQGNL